MARNKKAGLAEEKPKSILDQRLDDNWQERLMIELLGDSEALSGFRLFVFACQILSNYLGRKLKFVDVTNGFKNIINQDEIKSSFSACVELGIDFFDPEDIAVKPKNKLVIN